LIRYCINEDVSCSNKPVELRSQRVFAIKVRQHDSNMEGLANSKQQGVNSFLDVARQAFKELNDDLNTYFDDLKGRRALNRSNHLTTLTESSGLALDMKFEPQRQFFLKFPAANLADLDGTMPAEFINVFRKGKHVECQTMDLVKINHKIKDAHNEVLGLSDGAIQELINRVRSKIHPLFKISESIAMLDMLAGFTQVVTTCMYGEYTMPELNEDSLIIKSGRHPIREKLAANTRDRFVPNDVYATPQNRFHVITGANMSGKSTYIRSVALMAIMAQIGCFVPAEFASFPLSTELFARVSTDDCVEANVSTFASEMREMAFILRSITPNSLVIIDELGRGTSTTDGLAIAIAIAEALIDSKAKVWFVTHFRDLPRILADRAGVSNEHLSVDISNDYGNMIMRYKIMDGCEEEKFYGLALARVIGLPSAVLDMATRVSKTLHDRNEARKRNPKATAVARRRKLILNVKEQLGQAKESAANGNMSAEHLRDWLKRLQIEFTVRMKAIDADAEAAKQREDASSVVKEEETSSEDCGAVEAVELASAGGALSKS
jgi:DNA mismatch repair protein MSH4